MSWPDEALGCRHEPADLSCQARPPRSPQEGCRPDRRAAAVFQEIAEYPDAASEKIENAKRSWLSVRAVADRRLVEVLMADLDAGESEVIALALELAAERVVLDDLDARRLSQRLGVSPVGTLGLMLAAKLRGEIQSLRTEIDKLRQAGFRVSPALSQAVLLEAGE